MDLEWEDEKLKSAVIIGGENVVSSIPVVYKGVVVNVNLGPGETVALSSDRFTADETARQSR